MVVLIYYHSTSYRCFSWGMLLSRWKICRTAASWARACPLEVGRLETVYTRKYHKFVAVCIVTSAHHQTSSKMYGYPRNFTVVRKLLTILLTLITSPDLALRLWSETLSIFMTWLSIFMTQLSIFMTQLSIFMTQLSIFTTATSSLNPQVLGSQRCL